MKYWNGYWENGRLLSLEQGLQRNGVREDCNQGSNKQSRNRCVKAPFSPITVLLAVASTVGEVARGSSHVSAAQSEKKKKVSLTPNKPCLKCSTMTPAESLLLSLSLKCLYCGNKILSKDRQGDIWTKERKKKRNFCCGKSLLHYFFP